MTSGCWCEMKWKSIFTPLKLSPADVNVMCSSLSGYKDVLELNGDCIFMSKHSKFAGRKRLLRVERKEK